MSGVLIEHDAHPCSVHGVEEVRYAGLVISDREKREVYHAIAVNNVTERL